MKTLSEALFSRKNLKSKNPYGLTENELIDDIKGLPLGVVVRMIEEQELQGNESDVKVFQKSKIANNGKFGFNWNETEADYEFWSEVLSNCRYNLFFERYPDYERYNL